MKVDYNPVCLFHNSNKLNVSVFMCCFIFFLKFYFNSNPILIKKWNDDKRKDEYQGVNPFQIQF